MMIATVCLALVMAVTAFAWAITRLFAFPPRQVVWSTPGDSGLPFEAVKFPSKDGLELCGWWIPQRNAKRVPPSVILVHPLGGNRCGFSGIGLKFTLRLGVTIDFLHLAEMLFHAGFNVLMFDLRGHGESAAGRCAGGLNEDQDVNGAVHYVIERLMREYMLYPAPGARLPPEEQLQRTPPVGVIGYGIGATAAIAAVGRKKGGTEIIKVFNGDCEGGVGYVHVLPDEIKRLRFLILLEPASLNSVLTGCVNPISPFLAQILHPILNWMFITQGSYPLDNSLLRRFASQVNVPALFICAGHDDWGSAMEVEELFAEVPGKKQFWQDRFCPGRMHLLGIDSPGYPRILEFAQHHCQADLRSGDLDFAFGRERVQFEQAHAAV